MSQRVQEAIEFAKKAHAGQVRKGTTEPYFGHPMEVMEIAKFYGATEEVLMAAVLHDTYEDTGVTMAELEERFGKTVAGLIAEVSQPSGPPKPPYDFRKAAYLAQMRVASAGAALVAASDKIANGSSILRDYGKVGAAVFERFRMKREGTLKFYRAVTEALKPRLLPAVASKLEEVVSAMERLKPE